MLTSNSSMSPSEKKEKEKNRVITATWVICLVEFASSRVIDYTSFPETLECQSSGHISEHPWGEHVAKHVKIEWKKVRKEENVLVCSQHELSFPDCNSILTVNTELLSFCCSFVSMEDHEFNAAAAGGLTADSRNRSLRSRALSQCLCPLCGSSYSRKQMEVPSIQACRLLSDCHIFL